MIDQVLPAKHAVFVPFFGRPAATTAALTVAAQRTGAPVFVVMAGFALLLFYLAGTPVASVPAETFRLVVSPTLPAIPLLTVAGYVLAEGGAGHDHAGVRRAGPALAGAGRRDRRGRPVPGRGGAPSPGRLARGGDDHVPRA